MVGCRVGWGLRGAGREIVCEEEEEEGEGQSAVSAGLGSSDKPPGSFPVRPPSLLTPPTFSSSFLPPVSSPVQPMPTCRRKRVVLTEPSQDLVHALQTDPERQVFYLQETGEIFESYECVLFYYPPLPLSNIFFS